MQTIIDAAMPHILEIFGVLLTGVITWAANTARQKWGIEIEARHRDALHSALMTGARLAAANKLTGQTAVNMVLDYVAQSVPDALAKLAPDAGVLDDLARAKLGEAQDALSVALRQAVG